MTESVTPLALATPDDAGFLDDLIFELFCRLAVTGVTTSHLARMTFTAPKGRDLRAMLQRVQSEAGAGGWFILCQKVASTDAHGLLLTDCEADAFALAERFLTRENLVLGSVDVDDVRGWDRFRLGGSRLRLLKDLAGLCGYDLKLGNHVEGRAREIPVAAIGWGAFAGVEALAAFGLVPGGLPAPPAQRLCQWCRVGLLRPGQKPAAGCCATCRKRKERREREVRVAKAPAASSDTARPSKSLAMLAGSPPTAGESRAPFSQDQPEGIRARRRPNVPRVGPYPAAASMAPPGGVSNALGEASPGTSPKEETSF